MSIEIEESNYIKNSILNYDYIPVNEKLKFTSIVLISNNHVEYTKLCIESIRKFTNKNCYEIIVIDNNSTEEIISWLKSQDDLNVIYNSENISEPQAYNQGIKASKGENIALLNIDTIVTSNWLNNLQISLYSDDNIGIVGPMSNKIDNANSKLKCDDIEKILNISEKMNTSDINVGDIKSSISGPCILIKREVIDKVGVLDEIFNLGYYTKEDYCYRAICNGYKVLLSKNTLVYSFLAISYAILSNAYGRSLELFEEKWGFNISYSIGIRYDVISNIDNNIEDNINILEIGCSLGGTLLELKNKYKNANIYGIELDEKVCNITKNLFPTISENIEEIELPYEDNYFDYIIVADVLEHLKDPWTALIKFKKCLKKDGYVIASIPNIMHISVVKDILNGKFPYANAGILDKTHLRFFTLEEIYKLFNTMGYYVTFMTYVKVYIGSEEERNLINRLCLLFGEDKREQYESYQYIAKAKMK